MELTRYFGDGDKVFALKPELILELERKADAGIGALYLKFMGAQFHFADIFEIIRLGLIGGGMSPADAQILIDTYVKPRPILETYPLAFDILETLWSGNAEIPAPNAQGDLRQAAATGDLAAAISEAYKDVPDE